MIIFEYLSVIVQQYIVPFLFAIGLVFFIYAIVKYFILGPGEEPVREDGREYFIKANVWFFAGLVVYFVMAIIIWFFTFVGSATVDRGEETRTQPVPNTPLMRE